MSRHLPASESPLPHRRTADFASMRRGLLESVPAFDPRPLAERRAD